MAGNFIENEPLLRKFTHKQLKKFAKENKISLEDFRSNPWQPHILSPVLHYLDYEELMGRVAPEVEKNKIIEFAKKHGIDI